MTAVLIVSTLGILLLGYVVMTKLDAFLAGKPKAKPPHRIQRANVLVFGGSAEFYRLLDREGIPYRTTSKPGIPAGAVFSVFLALSNDDLDNLTACNRAKHALPGIRIIALCNDYTYMDMYTDAVGTGVLHGRPSPKDILIVMKGS